MSELSQAKILGGIGSLLMLLSFVPTVGGLLGIVGFILVLIAVKYVSDVVGDRSIFNNMLISVILGIVGIVVGLVVGIISYFSVFGRAMGMPSDFSEWFGRRPAIPENIISLLVGIIVGMVVIWIFYIISAIFLRKSFAAISSRLNVKLFGTAALLYLIGSALLIVLVGFVILLVALIIQTIAFFSIPETLPQQTTISQPM
jgi:uncharacterized membrane protein